MQMTMLLALATAFTIFTLVFNATQAQRVQDVANYQTGADFSGTIPNGIFPPSVLESLTKSYMGLPGVQSATLGYSQQGYAGGNDLNIQVNLTALDSSRFARTAVWSNQDSVQSLSQLMTILRGADAAGVKQGILPVIVDEHTWNTLHLSWGATFSLNLSRSAVSNPADLVQMLPVLEVLHIPTSGDGTVPKVLADYLTFATIYTHGYTTTSGDEVSLNTVWLRTSDNARLLIRLRANLTYSSLQLSPLYDRRAMLSQFYHEPLYLTLVGVLLLGSLMALLLALVGNLVASWLNARARLANFAALRALGATPRQLASTLGWEQVIIYSLALILGFLAGWLMAELALPSLIFTSIAPNSVTDAVSSSTFYAAQLTPPIQIVVPSVLWVVLASLVLLCALALSMMVRVATHPSIAQVLRLNED
jgi:hypothetical protein